MKFVFDKLRSKIGVKKQPPVEEAATMEDSAEMVQFRADMDTLFKNDPNFRSRDLLREDMRAWMYLTGAEAEFNSWEYERDVARDANPSRGALFKFFQEHKVDMPKAYIKAKEVKDILSKLYTPASDEAFAIQEQVSAFANMLLATYPKAKDNIFFHFLTHSSFGVTKDSVFIDFSGTDSVVEFVEQLAEKYKKK